MTMKISIFSNRFSFLMKKRVSFIDAGHQKVGNYIYLIFCLLSAGFQKTYIGLKGKKAQNQQKEEKPGIILIG